MRRSPKITSNRLKIRKALQLAKLSVYEPLIIKGNKRNLRQACTIWVAHAALDYFSNNERELQKHAASFEINDPVAFAPAPEFTKHTF